MRKLIVQVRVNEGQMRSSNPHVPYSPEEIAHDVVKCWRAGASVVHWHAREPQSGALSTDAALYVEAARLIKRECDIVLFPTLGANALPTVRERIAHIAKMASDPATRPDCVPADMITTNMDFYDRERKQFRGSRDRIYLNTTKMLEELCVSVKALGVRPVAMMWNIAGIRLTQAFIEMGHFTQPLMCEFTTFGEGFEEYGHPATIQGLQALVDFIPEGADWHWMVSTIGANPFPLYAYAIARGGHVAVGLGDHPYPEFGHPANAQLVERVVQMAGSMGREIATAAEVRQLFGFAVK
jgi:3-keto-5-aminohexanoate cleavage enzyme